MGTIYKAELERRIERGELITEPRRVGDKLDLQPASYDLMSGTIVWKDSQGDSRVLHYKPEHPFNSQEHVTLQPGQMISVITHEELRVPIDCCASVFSKNNLALSGIFAFNAGHVDPGYSGPIIVRLLSLRSSPFTITLGKPIFTVVFEKLDVASEDKEKLVRRGPLTKEEALAKVLQFADVALTNALFDLYAGKIQEILDTHRSATLLTIQGEMEKTFVKADGLNARLAWWAFGAVGTAIVFVGIVLGMMSNWGRITGILPH